MDSKTLIKKIKILLDNSVIQPCPNYLVIKHKEKYLTRTGSSEIEVEDNLDDFEFNNEQVILLKKMYLQLSPEDRTLFQETLLEQTIPGSGSEIAKTAVNTLVHTGSFELIFNLIVKFYKNYNQTVFISELDEISEILKHEWTILKPEEIDKFNEWLNDILEGKNELGQEMRNYQSLYRNHLPTIAMLYRQTNIIITKRLREEITSGFNPEINQDQQTLKNEFRRFGFPTDLSETLQKLDQKFAVAVDAFDFKGCMDLIRSFTERFYKTIAVAMDKESGSKVNEKDSEKVAKYFIEKSLISEDQGKILIALRHFLSNFGSHRLRSKPEDARVSRNMTIEFTLYLLRRFEELKNSKKN